MAGSHVGDPDKRARELGIKLSSDLSAGGGQWVLFEAFHEDDDGDEVWLGKTAWTRLSATASAR